MPLPVTTAIPNHVKTFLRNSYHSQVQRTLNVTPKIVVAQAQINQTVFRYPLSSLGIDNKAGDWEKVKPGMMVLIGDAPGKFNVGVGIIRRLPGNALLHIDPKSKGDPGSPMGTRNIFRALEDNFYVTVIKFYPVFATLSRIADGIFYKAYDRAYNGELFDLPPVANIGDWQAVTVNPVTGLAQFVLTSAASFAYQNKSIVGRTWDTDELDIVEGTTTSEGVTLEGPAGFYVVSCTVRDTTNRTHTARVYLWANALSGQYAPFSSAHGVTLGGIRQDRQGGEMTFTAAGEQASEIYPFQGVLYTRRLCYPILVAEIGFKGMIAVSRSSLIK